MPADLPLWIPVLWLTVTVLAQSAVDTPLSRDKLPHMPVKTLWWSWVCVNSVTILLLVLVFRLMLFPQEAWLISARENGWMSFAVLILAAEYFLWGVPYAWGRGLLMQRWKAASLSAERSNDYWSYVWSSSLVGFFLTSILYVAVQIVIPLMAGTSERFGG